jgi:hypothetical protein
VNGLERSPQFDKLGGHWFEPSTAHEKALQKKGLFLLAERATTRKVQPCDGVRLNYGIAALSQCWS